MQHEVFFICAFKCINELFVIAGAERGNDQRLCFTSGKQCRSMGTRQNTNFGNNRAHIGKTTTVNTFFGVQNTATHNVTFQTFKCA